MKKHLITLTACAAFIGIAHAQNAPLTYTGPNGVKNNVTMVSGVSSNGTPAVSSYTGADGKQKTPLVTVNVCSVVNGVPQICPPVNTGLTQSQADARYIQQVSGSFSGILTGASGSVISMPGGYLQALAAIYVSPDLNSSTLTSTDNNGNYNIIPSNANGGIIIKSSVYAKLPTSPVNQTTVYCSDCLYNGYTGVILRWSSAQNWWMTPENTVYNTSGTPSFLQTSGGTLTGAPTIKGNAKQFPIYYLADVFGDAAEIDTILNNFNQTRYVFNAQGNQPFLTLTGNSTQVDALTIVQDSTNSFSGYIISTPNPISISAGSVYPQGSSFIQKDAASAPSSSSSCTAGTVQYVGSYMYRCISSGNWGRIALQTGY